MKNTIKSITSQISNQVHNNKGLNVKNYNLKIKGEGQLINNDCLSGMKNLPDNSIDLVLTDPPYGIADKNRTTFVGSKGGKPLTTQEAWGNDFQDNFGDIDGFWEWFKPFMSEMTRVTKDGGSIILFLDAKYQGHFVYLIEKEFGLKFRNNIYFTKTNARTLNMKGYAHSCEQAIWFTKGKLPFTYNNPMQALRKNNPNVFSGSVGTKKETTHPCEKYSWMIEPLIERHSLEGQLILDPFGGSASTLVYGIKQGRKVIAFEKNVKFFEMAKERIMKHNLDVRFFEPNKKTEQKQEVNIEVNTIELNSKINELDDSAKKQVHDFINSLLTKTQEFVDEPEPAEKVSKTTSENNSYDGIIEELSSIKTNVDNDYMSEKTRSKIKSLISELKNHPNKKKFSYELMALSGLDFKQKLYCDIKTKVAFVDIVNRIKDKLNDFVCEELEAVA